MKWFGDPWPGAAGLQETPTPVGMKCGYFRCPHTIEDGDSGVVTTFIEAGGQGIREVAFHRFCTAFSVGAYTEHEQDEPCNCDEIFQRRFTRR